MFLYNRLMMIYTSRSTMVARL